MPIDRRFLNGVKFSAEEILTKLPSNINSLSKYSCYLFIDNDNSSSFIISSVKTKDSFRWLYLTPMDGWEVFVQKTKQLLRYNSTTNSWDNIFTLPAEVESPPAFFTEVHSLTAAEAEAKSFNLSFKIAKGEEKNVLCYLENVSQIIDEDFSVEYTASTSAYSIRWTHSGPLSYIGLQEGDTFIVRYKKAV